MWRYILNLPLTFSTSLSPFPWTKRISKSKSLWNREPAVQRRGRDSNSPFWCKFQTYSAAVKFSRTHWSCPDALWNMRHTYARYIKDRALLRVQHHLEALTWVDPQWSVFFVLLWINFPNVCILSQAVHAKQIWLSEKSKTIQNCSFFSTLIPEKNIKLWSSERDLCTHDWFGHYHSQENGLTYF